MGLLKFFFTIKNDIPLIFPGSSLRRNYSTNAIDNGIFLDSICSNFSVKEIEKLGFKSIIDNIAVNYCAKKIQGDIYVPNQILWSAKGLSKWQKKYSINRYNNLLIDVVENFFKHIDYSGQVNYSFNLNNRGLDGPTTYYHSRCIAFIIQILIDLDSIILYKSQIKKLVVGLFNQYKLEGYKQLTIESKRYYFYSKNEIDSFPFDLYVFYAYKKYYKDSQFDYLASKSLKYFLKNFRVKRKNKVQNWQCDHMRLTHLAWICKVDKKYINHLIHFKNEKINLSLDLNKKKTVFPIYINNSTYHFISKKSPINLFSGGLFTGLITNDNNPNNIFKLNFTDYQEFNCKYFKFFNLKEIKHFLFHIYDWIIFKKNIKQFFYLTFYQLLGGIYSSFLLRLSFNNEIQYKVSGNKILYPLILSNKACTYKKQIGHRTIIFSNKRIIIQDKLIKEKFIGKLKKYKDVELQQTLL